MQKTTIIDKNGLLKLIVFLSGAVLMGLEIVGGRIMAIHFGNTIFIWGGLISVFLTGLSLGYYIGGKLADKYPSSRMLGTVLGLSGILILLIPVVEYPIGELIEKTEWGLKWGPLVFSTVVFLIPSILMGTTSPYAIKLCVTDLKSIGKLSGTLYAISTLGSIFGTLITTFYLIPSFNLAVIIVYSFGLTLIIVGIVLNITKKKILTTAILGLMTLVLGCGLIYSTEMITKDRYKNMSIIFNQDTAYQTVTVVDNKNVRELLFGKYIESSIFLNHPDQTAARYTDLFHLAFIFNTNIKSVLFIGGGGGIGPKKFIKDYPEVIVDLVEIDPVVIDIAHNYFFLPKSNLEGEYSEKTVPISAYTIFKDSNQNIRLRSYAEDGRIFLKKCSKKWDLIVLDAFAIGGRIPFTLMTKEFMQLVKDHLNQNGLVMSNLNSALECSKAKIYEAEARTYYEVFNNFHTFPIYQNEFDPQNIILLSENQTSNLSKDSIVKTAIELDNSKFVKVKDYVKYARNYYNNIAQILNGSRGILLLDQFSPVENMTQE